MGAYQIKLDARFTKKSKTKQQQKKSNRGHVKISLEEPPESPSFDGFDDTPYETQEITANHQQNEDTNAQFIVTSNANMQSNELLQDELSKKTKKKKKKKKKYKTKSKGSEIDLLPLSNSSNKAGEAINDKPTSKVKIS